MKDFFTKSKLTYNNDFKKYGLNAQRRYPNEELCRFFGRNYFSLYPKSSRAKINILETGSGSGGNLSMISNEGFSAYGIDFSSQAVKLCKQYFAKKKLKANLKIGDFKSTSYKDNFFDCVVDVFSSCSLNKLDGKIYLKEVNRILKKNGIFFSYFPSKKSDMFNYKSVELYDSDTIQKLNHKSAFSPEFVSRFMHMEQYCRLLVKNGFAIKYKEYVMRTYFLNKEKFYFLVLEAVKV